MDRVFDAALPVLSAGATDKDRLAEISIVLSRTLVELTSEGVTAYTDLLKLTLEPFPLWRTAPPLFGLRPTPCPEGDARK
jgi:hypothetical protein